MNQTNEYSGKSTITRSIKILTNDDQDGDIYCENGTGNVPTPWNKEKKMNESTD